MGAVVLQCAAARSLAQMSRDSKVKMRALRGERLEKRKIKSRARRPLPFAHAAAAPQSASGRGAAADGTEGRARRRCRLCCVRDIFVWYMADSLRIGVILPTKFDIIFKNEILSEKRISLSGETYLFNRAQVHILFAGERKHICLSCSPACSNRPTPCHSIGVRRRISFVKNEGICKQAAAKYLFGLSALCGYVRFCHIAISPRALPRRCAAREGPGLKALLLITDKLKNSYYKQAALQSLRAPTVLPLAPVEGKTRKALQKKAEAVLALYGSRFLNRACFLTSNFPAFPNARRRKAASGIGRVCRPKSPPGRRFRWAWR